MRCLYNRLLVLTVVAFPTAVNAATEVNGTISQLFYADDTQNYNSINDIPVEINFFQIQNPVSISYDNGELVVLESIALQKGTDIREGSLSFTVDLSAIQISDKTPIDNQFLRAEYRETQGGAVVFQGSLSDSNFWIVDFCSSGYLFGVEGKFDMILSDVTGAIPGCRVFLNGYFSTSPTPEQCRQSKNSNPNPPSDSDDVFVEDYGGGCGGTDTSETSDSCEGDSTSDNSGGSDCEGDSGDSDSGCEGDDSTNDSGYDVGSETCESAPRGRLATRHIHKGDPLGVLSRWLPELMVLAGVYFFRSRSRKNRSEK